MKIWKLFQSAGYLGLLVALSACPSEPLESSATHSPKVSQTSSSASPLKSPALAGQTGTPQAQSTRLPGLTRQVRPTSSLPPRPSDLTTKSNYRPNLVYSSLILDARGLRVAASMSPSILVNQQEIYPSAGELDTDYLVNVGLAAYVYGSVNDAKKSSRAGQLPLIIRPLAAQGPGGSGVTLSPADGQNLLAAERRSGILKGFKVIFLLDKTD